MNRDADSAYTRALPHRLQPQTRVLRIITVITAVILAVAILSSAFVLLKLDPSSLSALSLYSVVSLAATTNTNSSSSDGKSHTHSGNSNDPGNNDGHSAALISTAETGAKTVTATALTETKTETETTTTDTVTLAQLLPVLSNANALPLLQTMSPHRKRVTTSPDGNKAGSDHLVVYDSFLSHLATKTPYRNRIPLFNSQQQRQQQQRRRKQDLTPHDTATPGGKVTSTAGHSNDVHAEPVVTLGQCRPVHVEVVARHGTRHISKPKAVQSLRDTVAKAMEVKPPKGDEKAKPRFAHLCAQVKLKPQQGADAIVLSDKEKQHAKNRQQRLQRYCDTLDASKNKSNDNDNDDDESDDDEDSDYNDEDIDGSHGIASKTATNGLTLSDRVTDAASLFDKFKASTVGLLAPEGVRELHSIGKRLIFDLPTLFTPSLLLSAHNASGLNLSVPVSVSVATTFKQRTAQSRDAFLAGMCHGANVTHAQSATRDAVTSNHGDCASLLSVTAVPAFTETCTHTHHPLPGGLTSQSDGLTSRDNEKCAWHNSKLRFYDHCPRYKLYDQSAAVPFGRERNELIAKYFGSENSAGAAVLRRVFSKKALRKLIDKAAAKRYDDYMSRFCAGHEADDSEDSDNADDFDDDESNDDNEDAGGNDSNDNGDGDDDGDYITVSNTRSDMKFAAMRFQDTLDTAAHANQYPLRGGHKCGTHKLHRRLNFLSRAQARMKLLETMWKVCAVEATAQETSPQTARAATMTSENSLVTVWQLQQQAQSPRRSAPALWCTAFIDTASECKAVESKDGYAYQAFYGNKHPLLSSRREGTLTDRGPVGRKNDGNRRDLVSSCPGLVTRHQLEYFQDLASYTHKGPLFASAFAHSCPLVTTMLSDADNAVSAVAATTRLDFEQSGGRLNYPAARLDFAHAETIMPLLSLLGIQSTDVPLLTSPDTSTDNSHHAFPVAVDGGMAHGHSSARLNLKLPFNPPFMSNSTQNDDSEFEHDLESDAGTASDGNDNREVVVVSGDSSIFPLYPRSLSQQHGKLLTAVTDAVKAKSLANLRAYIKNVNKHSKKKLLVSSDSASFDLAKKPLFDADDANDGASIPKPPVDCRGDLSAPSDLSTPGADVSCPPPTAPADTHIALVELASGVNGSGSKAVNSHNNALRTAGLHQSMTETSSNANSNSVKSSSDAGSSVGSAFVGRQWRMASAVPMAANLRFTTYICDGALDAEGKPTDSVKDAAYIQLQLNEEVLEWTKELLTPHEQAQCGLGWQYHHDKNLNTSNNNNSNSSRAGSKSNADTGDASSLAVNSRKTVPGLCPLSVVRTALQRRLDFLGVGDCSQTAWDDHCAYGASVLE